MCSCLDAVWGRRRLLSFAPCRFVFGRAAKLLVQYGKLLFYLRLSRVPFDDQAADQTVLARDGTFLFSSFCRANLVCDDTLDA